MYQPERYKKNSTNFAVKLIRQNPFGEFVLQGDRLLATHIPILINEDSDSLQLFAHIANHNPQKQFLKDGKEALLILKGSDAYVSSSWYEEKEISTWDYSAVHIHCRIRVQTSDELVASLKKLVHHFEKDQMHPLEYNQIPDSIIESNLSEITGFWCEPILIEGIGKWHQGFGKKDVLNVINHLKANSCPHHDKLVNQLKEEHDL